jgi:hypothetical protein
MQVPPFWQGALAHKLVAQLEPPQPCVHWQVLVPMQVAPFWQGCVAHWEVVQLEPVQPGVHWQTPPTQLPLLAQEGLQVREEMQVEAMQKILPFTLAWHWELGQEVAVQEPGGMSLVPGVQVSEFEAAL